MYEVDYDSYLECYVLVINDETIYLEAKNHQDALFEAKKITYDFI